MTPIFTVEMHGCRPDTQDIARTVTDFCGAGNRLLARFDESAAPTRRASARSRSPRSPRRIVGSIAQTLEETFVSFKDVCSRNSPAGHHPLGPTDGSAPPSTPSRHSSASRRTAATRAPLIRANALRPLSLDHKPTHPDEDARHRDVTTESDWTWIRMKCTVVSTEEERDVRELLGQRGERRDGPPA